MNCTVHCVHHRGRQRTRLLIALALAVAVFAVEATASIFANSLALLAEAFHVLIDVVALGIAFVAVWLGTRPVTDRRTFGLLRLEILATPPTPASGTVDVTVVTPLGTSPVVP